MRRGDSPDCDCRSCRGDRCRNDRRPLLRDRCRRDARAKLLATTSRHTLRANERRREEQILRLLLHWPANPRPEYQGEPTYLEVGDENTFREFVTISRSTSSQGKTLIGNRGTFLAYSHIAHDCVVGDDVVFSNNGTLAGMSC